MADSHTATFSASPSATTISALVAITTNANDHLHHTFTADEEF
jgi:hypothetical protein